MWCVCKRCRYRPSSEKSRCRGGEALCVSYAGSEAVSGVMVTPMTMGGDPESAGHEFTIEDISTGVFASGFGHLGDGRSFSFHPPRSADRRGVPPRLAGPVPKAEDVVATATRSLADFDVDDERSLAAEVGDAVADAQPVPRPAR